MALSQDEQRKLEAIEDAFLQDDPRFAKTFTLHRLRRRAANFGHFLVGVILLLTGAMASRSFLTAGVLIAVAGYVVMVGSAARWFGRRSV
jgi:hypothetical protein